MYHTVRIRDLAPQSLNANTNQQRTGHKQESSSISKQYWADSINGSSNCENFDFDSDSDSDSGSKFYSNGNKYRQTYFKANGSHTHIINSGHALFEAYLAAYNAHEDLVLSPDDIWLMITIYYARYVVDHAEQMRHLFVEHEGKKKLVVEMNTFEPDWPNFLNMMTNQVGTHVKNNVVGILTSNFSTTGSVEKLLSSVCIMHTFKKYFDYEQLVCGCGIRNVHFMGTIDDWILLRKKTEELKLFTVPSPSHGTSNRGFHAYLDGVLPILDQFIQTYKGNVDNNFWDTIFDYTKIGVAGPSGMYKTEVTGIRGWFLRLCFGCHWHGPDSKGVLLKDIGLDAISVPVKLVDLPRGGKETSCHVVGGFHGIHSSKDGKHRPVMSLAVFEEVEKKTISQTETTPSEDVWF